MQLCLFTHIDVACYLAEKKSLFSVKNDTDRALFRLGFVLMIIQS